MLGSTITRTAAEVFARYGYEPIYTPLFEHTEVFVRGIGEATDIVGKEMYTFLDKGGRSITLRPEGTAPVVRAALEHDLVANGQSAKLYYSGPMFRYERPQKGRTRQFWQIGAEALGMARAHRRRRGHRDAHGVLRSRRACLANGCGSCVNSMGDEKCRPAYRDNVADFIRAHAEELCDECVRRAETNPLRAFDCKNEGCRAIMSHAPLLRDELCDECAAHYAAVKSYLDALGIAYEEDPSLVRGLDYYTRTVFEIQAEGLGSQNAIGGGGRYDRLMEQYGGAAHARASASRSASSARCSRSRRPASRCPRRRSAEVFVARVAPEAAREVFALDGCSARRRHRRRDGPPGSLAQVAVQGSPTGSARASSRSSAPTSSPPARSRFATWPRTSRSASRSATSADVVSARL